MKKSQTKSQEKETTTPKSRLTKTKKAITDVLKNSNCLISKTEIIKKLSEKNINPNRSTIYRELKLLEQNGTISRNTILKTDYFEIPHDHHHHLVCVTCNKINKICIPNHLEKQEEEISKKNNFKILNHTLEFYGHCQKCQKNSKNNPKQL